MQLESNKDQDDIPKVVIPQSNYQPDLTNPLEEWISKFPYDALKEDSVIELAFRCGEKRNEGKEYRRLRVRVSLTNWLPLNPE